MSVRFICTSSVLTSSSPLAGLSPRLSNATATVAGPVMTTLTNEPLGMRKPTAAPLLGK